MRGRGALPGLLVVALACNAASTSSGDAGAGGSPWADWPMPNSAVDVAAGAPNPQSYTNNGDGTITDGVTQLRWQQSAPAAPYAWSDASSY